MKGNTHVSDLKVITVNIFGANEAEGSMEEYGVQNACSIVIFSISISRHYLVQRRYNNILFLTEGLEVKEETHPMRNLKKSSM